MREALQGCAGQPGAGHLLLGLLSAEPNLAVGALELLGADPEAIRIAIERHLR